MKQDYSNRAAWTSRLEPLLRVFAKVRPGEGHTTLVLLASIFLMLTAYFLMKPVREAWLAVSMVAGLEKIEVKAYSAFGQSILLLALLPAYAALAARWTRRRLIATVSVVFGLILVAFWLSQPGLLLHRVPYAGLAFYLFVGIFSVGLVAQFWSLAADMYGEERGKRLFPMIAIGAAAGSAFGSWVGERMLNWGGMEAFDLLLLAIIPLTLAVACALHAEKRGLLGGDNPLREARRDEPAAPGNSGAFNLIGQHRYLAATAALVLVFNWVVTGGDNILFAAVQQVIENDLAALVDQPLVYEQALRNATAAFYGDLYFWINLAGLLLQSFVVSRLISLGGFQTLLLATPLISLIAYGSMIFAPVIAVIKMMKVAENASVHSLNNTARNMIWLPTTKEMLYKTKPTIDTLFVRGGDALAALTVLLGTRVWRMDVLDFFVFNLVLIVIWILIAVYVARENRRWVDRRAAARALIGNRPARNIVPLTPD